MLLPVIATLMFAPLTSEVTPQTTTVATEALSLTSDGKPSRCEIDFIVIARDDVDEPGKLLGVKGTFGLELIPGKSLFELVKLTYEDIEGDHISRDQAPYSVSLVGKSGKSNVAYRAYTASQQSGSLLAGFLIHGNDDVVEQLSADHRLKVLFNTREGGGDVLVDVDLLVLDSDGAKERRGGDTLRKFAGCAVPLLDEAKVQLEAEHNRQLAANATSDSRAR